MEREATPEIPLELLGGVADNFTGLRRAQVEQQGGRSGYQLVADLRYRFTAAGEPTPADEQPDDEPDQVASEILADVERHHAESGGHPNYLLRLFIAQKSGTTKEVECKFKVASSSVAAGDVEARARADMMHSMSSYVRQLQDVDLAQRRAHSGVIQDLGTLLREALNLRFEAFEDRAEAMLEVLGDDRPFRRAKKGGGKSINEDDEWSQARKDIKEFMHSPVGIAAGARLLGMKPEELKSMAAGIGNDFPTGVDKDDIRAILAKLGKSLSDEQRMRLVGELGNARAQKFLEGGRAKTAEAARQTIAELFADIDRHKKWDVFDKHLDKEQSALFARVFDLLDPPKS